MVETASPRVTFNWLLPLFAAVGTLLVFLPFAIASADLGEFIYIFVAVPTVTVVLMVLAIRKKGIHRRSALLVLIVYWVVSAALVGNYSSVRDAARWLIWSKGYKAAVLGQPASEVGDLKHTAWDGWGFAGENTIVYLVFDPNDSLAAAPKDRPPGKVSGLPCEVSRIRRLESHWFAVMFYTDTSWGHCG
jgi:hypothetical protein